MLPAELLQSRKWVADAPCREVGHDVFFTDDGAGGGAMSDTAVAKKFCITTCPVIGECLLAAFQHDEEYGVFGGTSPRDRLQMTRGSKPLPEWADERHVQAIRAVKRTTGQHKTVAERRAA